jgi:hypothetical protein
VDAGRLKAEGGDEAADTPAGDDGDRAAPADVHLRTGYAPVGSGARQRTRMAMAMVGV